MKLRMNEGSLRLRLRRSEVEAFGASGVVSSAVRFPDGRTLAWRLIAAPAAEIAVAYAEDCIEVKVPAALAKAWAEGNEVGLHGRCDGVEVLIEKDFRRTSTPSPDDHDRYPNPRAARPR
jgi:hypothetical protein